MVWDGWGSGEGGHGVAVVICRLVAGEKRKGCNCIPVSYAVCLEVLSWLGYELSGAGDDCPKPPGFTQFYLRYRPGKEVHPSIVSWFVLMGNTPRAGKDCELNGETS